jgi:fumarylacetoacetate (FAA) hydrolase family protein
MLSALAICSDDVAITNNSEPHPPTPSVLCTAPTARVVGVTKALDSLVRDTRARATGIYVSCAKILHGACYFSPNPPVV